MKRFRFSTLRPIILGFFILQTSISFAQSFNMRDTMVTLCTGTLYDTGGNLGDYGNDEDSSFTITVPGSSTISLNFVSMMTQNSQDEITIYDGPSSASPILSGPHSGGTPPAGPIISTGQSVTIRFVSNGSNVDQGFQIDWDANFNPNVTLSASANPVCIGNAVTFTVTDSSEAGDPTFDWFLNGTVAPGSADHFEYTNPSIANNDTVIVIMTAELGNCYSQPADTDTIVMIANPNVLPNVSMMASANPICPGDPVTFTVTDSSNAGADPDFAWTINSAPAPGASNYFSYANSSLVNDDTVRVIITAQAGGCYSQMTDTAEIVMVVTTGITPDVSISASDISICDGENVTFIVTDSTNGGPNPTFQWQLNGINVGADFFEYSNNSLSDNDIVRVIMASNSPGCLTTTNDTDSVIMNINPNPVVSIAGSTNLACNGIDTGSAQANGTGGSGVLSYLWTPTSQPTALATNLSPGSYQVTLTDDSACFDTTSVVITEPTAIMTSLTPTDASVFGGADGAINTVVTGGTVAVDYGFSWNTTPVQTTQNISNLVSRTYVVTVTDDNNCVKLDSAFVDQPALLKGGSIMAGAGGATKKVCDGDSLGQFRQSTAATGGVGPFTYTWQYSTDIINWVNFADSDSIGSFTSSDIFTQDIFVRRVIVDNANNDSALSNLVFADYIADISLAIVGLNSTYCENSGDVTMAGIPSNPSGFVSTAYVSGTTFRPANTGAGGGSYDVTYQYFDGNGCMSELIQPVIVNDTTVVNFALNSNYTPTSPKDTLMGTPPGGVFSGVGIYQPSAGIYVLDPSVPAPGSTVNIKYSFTDGNNCSSFITKSATIQNTNVSMVGFQLDETYCAYNDPDSIWLDLGADAPTIVSDSFFFRNLNTSLVYTQLPEVGNTLPGSFIFDPKAVIPVTSDDYEISIAYVYKEQIIDGLGDTIFQTSAIFDTIHVVNTGAVRIIAPQNSNGGTLPPFQYCENLTSVFVYGQHGNLGPTNVIQNSFNISSGTGLTHTNNSDTAFLNPSNPGLAPSNLITYTFTDSASGCFSQISRTFNIDTLPIVTLHNINEVSGYCANTGEVVFWGSPFSTGTGTFPSPTLALIPPDPMTPDTTFSFLANPANVGAQKIVYEYKHGTTGCVNRDSALFAIDTIPDVSVFLDQPETCLDVDSVRIYGRLGSAFNAGQGLITGTGVVGTSNTPGTKFDATVAGVAIPPFQNHLITYSYSDNNGCADTATATITVHSLPKPGFTVPTAKQQVCQVNDPVVMLPNNQLDKNELDQYVLKVGGVTFPIAGGIYNPATQTGSLGQNNTDTIVRIVTDTITGCSARDTGLIFINPNPALSYIGLDSNYCKEFGLVNFNFNPVSHGNPVNTSPQGNYLIKNSIRINYGSGVITNNDLNTGAGGFSFNPKNAIANQVTVTYTHTDSTTGCRSVKDSVVAITPLPTLSVLDSGIQVAGVYCYGLTGKVYGTPYNSPFDIVMDSIVGYGTTIITAPNDTAFNFNAAQPGIMPNTTPIDTVYFYYHDNISGCESVTKKVVKIERPDTAYFGFYDAGFDTTNMFNPDTTICQRDNKEVRFDTLRPVLLNGGSRAFFLNGQALGPTNKFTPSTSSAAVVGMNNGKYIYTTSSGCKDSIDKFIEIFPNPSIGWVTPKLCALDTILFTDTSKISSGSLLKRIWNYGDSPDDDTVFTNQAKHYFLNSGAKSLRLTVVSDRNCSSRIDTILEFGLPPIANFTWLRSDECGDTIHIRNRSNTVTGNSTDIDYSWDFGDGSVSTLDTMNINHGYTGGPDDYVVELVANISDCADTIRKVFSTRPSISQYPYFQNFENGPEGWVWEYDYDRDKQDTGRWVLGTPAKTDIKGPYSGNNSWVTGLTKNYINKDTTYVTSPCFDFTDLNRPMIRMWVNYSMDENDGVVLQYTTDPDTADKVKWKKLGDNPQNGINSGNNWYTKDGIAASPGKQSPSERNVGWTGKSQSPTGWIESRHDLDELKNLPYVRLRFAIGSGDDGIVGEGFAFDDIWIGERSKNVLMETFGNTNSLNSADANKTKINLITRNNPLDVLNAQFHTNFPGNDPLNYDNQADPSARALYYSISEVPFVVVDGNYFKNTPNSLNEQFVRLRTLLDPEFKVQLNTTKNGNQLTINSIIHANPVPFERLAVKPTDLTLHILVLEDSIATTQLPGNSVKNGESGFKNTLKQMIPTAAGTNYTHGWGNGEIESVTLTATLNSFKGSNDDWRVIAFVQNNKTKEIYQAVFNDSNNPTTGIDLIPSEDPNEFVFLVYPNPTSDITNFQFNQALDSRYNLKVVNQLGAIVNNQQLNKGILNYQLETSSLSEGIYYIVLTDETGNQTSRKLIISR